MDTPQSLKLRTFPFLCESDLVIVSDCGWVDFPFFLEILVLFWCCTKKELYYKNNSSELVYVKQLHGMEDCRNPDLLNRYIIIINHICTNTKQNNKNYTENPLNCLELYDNEDKMLVLLLATVWSFAVTM